MAQISMTSSRTLGTFSIWAIGVALVISGESFGWNNGWRHMGINGFMLPVLLVSVLYFALVRCNIELACVYPDADGPQSYAEIAFGKDFGRFVAFATLIEFLFASPAIANTIGEYIQYLSPTSFNSKWVASGFLVIFCIFNLFRIQVSTAFVILLTIFAIVELLIYFFSVSPQFEINRIQNTVYDRLDISSLISALPFAIWLYLGIEGVSLVTKNVRIDNFRKHISHGYYIAFWTLAVLIVTVLLLAGGSSVWNDDNWSSMVSETNGHPLPLSMEFSLGRSNTLVQIFTFLGMFGLIASLQGIVMASMKQIQSLMKIKNNQFYSSVLVLIVGLVSIWFQSTAFLIELSVFGAVCMYLFNGLSLLKLKKTGTLSFKFKNSDVSYKHSDFDNIKSYLSAALVVILSLFCASSLLYNHIWYFFAFALISAIYIALARVLKF